MSENRKKYPGIILVILIVCIFIGVSIFIMNYARESRVADVITVEAGTIMPEAFFITVRRNTLHTLPIFQQSHWMFPVFTI